MSKFFSQLGGIVKKTQEKVEVPVDPVVFWVVGGIVIFLVLLCGAVGNGGFFENYREEIPGDYE